MAGPVACEAVQGFGRLGRRLPKPMFSMGAPGLEPYALNPKLT